MGDLVARLNRVSAGYGGREIVRAVTLDVVRGRQVAVLGASGAGKSTLVKLLSGQLAPSSGTVELAETTRLAVVHQDAWLYPWLTVRENVEVGLSFGKNAVADRAGVGRILERLGIADVAESYPDEISGGQAQRAALGRALAIEPDLLLLDEPFSSLDPATRSELQQQLRTASVESGLTTVFVTHDIDEALILADDIVLVSAQGTVDQRWRNEKPAGHPGAAAVHPLRTELRAAYGSRVLEPDDEEFSGPWPFVLPHAPEVADV